jgi:prevent-host-death family protein
MLGTRTVDATELGDRFLELLDLVARTGEILVVMERGKPIARLVPVEPSMSLRGSVLWEKDLVSPIHDHWDREG